MKYKACKTCKFYEENIEKEEKIKEESIVRTFYNARCMHNLSDGRTSAWMVYRGPCGRDMKLWQRKDKKYSDIEVPETD